MAAANEHGNKKPIPSDSNKIKILLLEDNRDDAELILRRLKKDGGISFNCKRLETRAEYEEGIINFEPDLILADFSLPSFDGMKALAIARQKCPDVPFIFVSACLREEL